MTNVFRVSHILQFIYRNNSKTQETRETFVTMLKAVV